MRGERVFDGEAGHAGTVPMAGRRDALVAAAEYVVRVRDAAARIDGAVATVGVIDPFPWRRSHGPPSARKSRAWSPARRAPIGGRHDAAILAAAGVPTAMLFVRSLNGGVSHSPDEHTSPEDVELAVEVLTGALRTLAGPSN